MRKELDDPRQILRQKADCKYPGSRGPFSKYLIWNKPWSHLVDAASPRTISIIRKNHPLEPRLDCKQSTLNYVCWNLREMTYPDLESKERNELRAAERLQKALEQQIDNIHEQIESFIKYAKPPGRNSSSVNSQLSSLKKELTWQIEDFSCDHVLIPSNIRSYPRQTLNNRRCSKTKRG